MINLSKKKIAKIRKNVDGVNWFSLIYYYKLPEEFIREFANKINWGYISWYQILSEEFIIEFYDKVDWKTLWIYEKINKSIFEKLDKAKKLYLLMNWKEVYDQIK